MSATGEQIEACLTSDLIEDAKLLWIYLHACRSNGLGAPALVKRFPTLDVQLALEILEEAGRCAQTGGTYRAQPFPVVTKAKPGAVRSDEYSIITHAKLISRRYNQRRESVVGRPIMLTDTMMGRFESLAQWLTDNNVKFDDFLTFSAKRCGHMKSVPYPTPALLAGAWLRDEFIASADTTVTTARDAAPQHAGKSYYDPIGVKEWLLKGGIEDADTLPKRDLRYIYDYARHIVDDPDTAPEPTAKWAQHIAVVVEAIKEEARASAS